MNPTIHNYTASDLDSQGYGSLTDCISCEVTEELNGAYTLEMKYPLDGQLSEYLLPSNIIVAKPNHVQVKQPFRINEVKKSFGNSVEVFANHISYDMSGYTLRGDYTYNSLAELITAINNFSWSSNSPYYHQFTFGTDKTSSAKFTMPKLQTLRSWMGGQDGSILDVYGGEWIYDNFNVFLASRRGRDTGYRISYGKNLAEYEKQKEYNDFSHVCAYWKKSDTTVFGNLVATGMNCPFRATYYDASNEYENQPTIEQLDASATAQIAKLDPTAQTITVTPAQIGNDIIGLGDSVLICYETVLQTRVIKTVWDALAGAYKSIQLGSKKANITDTIKSLTTGPSGESGTITPADYVVEAANNQNDGYTKWNSGKLEVWKRSTVTVNVTSSMAGGLYYGTISAITYPQTFTTYPIVSITGQVQYGYGWLIPSYDNYAVGNTGTLYIYYTASKSNVSVTVNIYAVGKWK